MFEKLYLRVLKHVLARPGLSQHDTDNLPQIKVQED